MAKKIFSFAALVITVGIFVAACNANNDTPPPKEEEEKPPTKLTVTFDAAGGVPALKSVKVSKGDSIGILDFPPDPSRQSYRFMGWYTVKDGKGDKFISRTKVVNDQRVYAYWERDGENPGINIKPGKKLTGIEVAEPIGDILMGNFVGQVFDRSNFTVINVYDDGSRSETENYTASIPNYAITSQDIFTAGRNVSVTFTSTENAACTTTITSVVSKTLANTGLPVVYIDTKDAAPIVSKDIYIKTNIKIVSEDPPFSMENADYVDEIRGRGNSTWSYDKRPFRIKFDKKTPIFGLTGAKSWVLLANWKDWTLLTATVAFELAHRLEMPYTNHAFHVDVVLNGNYYGSFVLTEQVQVNPGRVDIDSKNGYLVEFDTYEDTNFTFETTTTELPVWVKSPEPEDLPAQGYQFVVDSVNEFDRLLNGSDFPNNGYWDILNIDSFVNYLMVYEITQNHELGHPKSAFMHKNLNGLITMGPVWDFDWAFGLGGSYSVNTSEAMGRYTTVGNRFGNFHNDPAFTELYKARWNAQYSQIESMPAFIDAMYEKIKVSESLDAQRWFNIYNINYAYQVDKLKTFWSNRVSYLNTEINK